VVAEFSVSVQTGPRTHPASYTMGTGSFPGVKRRRRDSDHPPQTSAEVKERLELYICSVSGPYIQEHQSICTSLFVCLFLARQSPVGQGLLIIEVS